MSGIPAPVFPSKAPAPAAAAASAPMPAPPLQPTATAGTPADQFPPPTRESVGLRPLNALSTNLMTMYRYCRVEETKERRQRRLEMMSVLAHNDEVLAQARKGGHPVKEEPSNSKKSEEEIIAQQIADNPYLKLASSISDIATSERQQLATRFNHGYDDKDGHYVSIKGEEIANRFIILESLGKGSFGTVVRAFDMKTNEPVAVKISRSGNYFINQAKLEVNILLHVNGNPKLNTLAVKLRKYLMWQQHAVLVFQLLSINLYHLLKLSKLRGVSLDLTRKFAVQLTQILIELDKSNPPIIHCDLKPENVLLFDQQRSGIRVIDFGSACYDNVEANKHKYIQSRFYRAPEVILGLPYGTAIDRWSTACIAFEMHVGHPLFPGKTEVEQLARMHALMGPPPASVLARADQKKLAAFYTIQQGANGKQEYILRQKPDPSHPTDLGTLLGVKTGGPGGLRQGDPGHTEATYELFLDFLRSTLTYDPDRRATCSQMYTHPFMAVLTNQLNTAPVAQ